MASTGFHEAPQELSAEVRERHRAFASLIEELEAVDWYDQRIDATDDSELARILAHNRDEEKEHAAMTLEWIRRRDPVFDEHLRRFLFGTGPIVGAGHGSAEARSPGSLGPGSLGIGGLRHEGARR